LLGEELGSANACVDHRSDAVDDRDYPKQARASDREELPGSQYHCLLPLAGQPQRGEDNCRKRDQ